MCYFNHITVVAVHELPDDEPIIAYKVLRRIRALGSSGPYFISPIQGTPWRDGKLSTKRVPGKDSFATTGIYCFATRSRASAYGGGTVVKVALSGRVVEHRGRRYLGGYSGASVHGYRAERARIIKEGEKV